MSVGGCEFGTNIIMCSPRGWMARSIQHCPVCGQRRRFIITLLGYYGADRECCGCGTLWQDGERTTTLEQSAARLPDVKARWVQAMTMKAAQEAEYEYLFGGEAQ